MERHVCLSGRLPPAAIGEHREIRPPPSHGEANGFFQARSATACRTKRMPGGLRSLIREIKPADHAWRC